MSKMMMSRIRFFCLFVIVVACFLTSARAQEPAIPKADISTALKDLSQLSGGEKNMILPATGLPQASDFDVGKLVANLIFSGIGFIAFIYGKKNAFWKPMVIGIVLMGYTYFISETLSLYLIGIGLTAALYFWRD